MRLKFILLFVFTLCSCANNYKIEVEDKVEILETNMLGVERFYLCDVDCKTTTKTLDETHTQVTEELYLLVSHKTDDVIYLTTKTNRSFDKTPDIFNTEAHEDYVLVNDLENVYFGKKTKENIIFTNKNETLILYLESKTKPCKIAIASILSKGKVENEINNTTIALGNIYDVPFEFNLSNRVLAIKEKQSNNFDIVNSIELTKSKVRFNGNIDFIEGSKRRRLKYHPKFDLK